MLVSNTCLLTQFFLPVPLEDGWIVIMWDMMSRKLHVLDPLIRGEGPHDATRDKHEILPGSYIMRYSTA